MDNTDVEEYKTEFGNLIKETMDLLNQLRSETVNQITNVMSGALMEFANNVQKQIADLGLNGVDKEAMVENLSKWGEFGWPVLEFASFDLYYKTAPTSCAEADEKALVYCTEEVILDLFNQIREDLLDKKDFDDAVFCYENSRWKPCAMVLFGIIEAMLIRFQPKSHNWRAIGGKAAVIIENSIVEKNNQTPRSLTYGRHLATLTAVQKMYESAHDFSNENPDIINRQFVNHGMTQREVTKPIA